MNGSIEYRSDIKDTPVEDPYDWRPKDGENKWFCKTFVRVIAVAGGILIVIIAIVVMLVFLTPDKGSNKSMESVMETSTKAAITAAMHPDINDAKFGELTEQTEATKVNPEATYRTETAFTGGVVSTSSTDIAEAAATTIIDELSTTMGAIDDVSTDPPDVSTEPTTHTETDSNTSTQTETTQTEPSTTDQAKESTKIPETTYETTFANGIISVSTTDTAATTAFIELTTTMDTDPPDVPTEHTTYTETDRNTSTQTEPSTTNQEDESTKIPETTYETSPTNGKTSVSTTDFASTTAFIESTTTKVTNLPDVPTDPTALKDTDSTTLQREESTTTSKTIHEKVTVPMDTLMINESTTTMGVKIMPTTNHERVGNTTVGNLTKKSISTSTPGFSVPISDTHTTEIPTTKRSSTLVYAQVLFRNGAQSGDVFSDSLKSKDVSINERGRSSSSEVGNFLRRRYVETGFLSTHGAETEWICSSKDGSLITIKLVRQGMFPDNWYNIPALLSDQYYSFAQCKNIDKIFMRSFPNCLTVNNIQLVLPFQGALQEVGITFQKVIEAQKIVNNIRSESALYSDIVSKYMEDVVKKYELCHGSLNLDLEFRIMYFEITTKIVREFEQTWKMYKSRTLRVKFQGFSAEDWMMMGVLKACGVFGGKYDDGILMEYSSLIVIELWDIDGEPFVKIFLKSNEHDSSFSAKHGSIKSCSATNGCPLNTFISMIHFDLGEFVKLCNN